MDDTGKREETPMDDTGEKEETVEGGGGKDGPIFSRLDWAAFFVVLGVALLEGFLFFGPGRDSGGREGAEARPDTAVAMSLMEAMGGGDPTGYERALEPRPFDFPADHAAHPGFRTEWWYVTSNLEAADGRRFGVHYTIFRSALRPPAQDGTDSIAAPGAAWATNDVYMGHFAIADVERERFVEAERFTRAAAGLAGAAIRETAEGERFRLWMDDWAMESQDAPTPGPDGVFPLRMTARDPDQDIAIDLVIAPTKPVVLQGDRGLSQKGDEPGNASYYYSFTRMRTEGSIVVAGDTVAVQGQSWMDREWSTSALDATQAGWDWFALQLDDGRDLMVYRLRGVDGSTDPLSKGVLVSPDGASTPLSAADFTLDVEETWESPIDGAVYPSTWRVRVPSEGVDLRVQPVLRDQEMDVTVRYWEGAVDLFDATADAGRSPIGRGYVELTGYAGVAPPGG